MNSAELAQCAPGETQQSAPAIRLLGIDKTFRSGEQTIQVLRDVNLTVGSRAIVGLIGTSGSGKSTLLNIVAGIVTPDRGQVCICGAPSEAFNDWCSVGYMFQEDRLLPWRTAIRNVEFALETGSIPKSERTRRASWTASKTPSRINSPAGCGAALRWPEVW